MFNGIKEIIAYRYMISGLVHRDLRGRYKGSILGFLWTFINPLCQIIVYYFVFSTVFNTSLSNYHVYLVSGMFAWGFFSESLYEGSGSIVALGDMTKKIYFPREVLPISTVTSKFINFLLTLIVVAAVILFSNVGFSIHLIYLPFILITQYIFCLSLAIFFSSVTVYYRDIQFIINVLMMILIWTAPIMYEYNPTEAFFWKIINLNPMTYIINAYHDIFYYHRTPNTQVLLIVLGCSLVFLIFADWCFRKLEKKFAENL